MPPAGCYKDARSWQCLTMVNIKLFIKVRCVLENGLAACQPTRSLETGRNGEAAYPPSSGDRACHFAALMDRYNSDEEGITY